MELKKKLVNFLIYIILNTLQYKLFNVFFKLFIPILLSSKN